MAKAWSPASRAAMAALEPRRVCEELPPEEAGPCSTKWGCRPPQVPPLLWPGRGPHACGASPRSGSTASGSPRTASTRTRSPRSSRGARSSSARSSSARTAHRPRSSSARTASPVEAADKGLRDRPTPATVTPQWSFSGSLPAEDEGRAARAASGAAKGAGSQRSRGTPRKDSEQRRRPETLERLYELHRGLTDAIGRDLALLSARTPRLGNGQAPSGDPAAPGLPATPQPRGTRSARGPREAPGHTTLQDHICKLEAMNEDLVRRNAALKGQVSTAEGARLAAEAEAAEAHGALLAAEAEAAEARRAQAAAEADASEARCALAAARAAAAAQLAEARCAQAAADDFAAEVRSAWVAAEAQARPSGHRVAATLACQEGLGLRAAGAAASRCLASF